MITVVTLNEVTPIVKFPILDFTWTQPTKGDPLPKMEMPGQHDRRTQVDVMSLNMEGHIVGNSTDQYWTHRKELLKVVIPDYEDSQVYRYTSHIQVKFDGDSETYYANVILKDHEEPMSTSGPGWSVTPFQFQWECAFGYWRKLSNNEAALI